MAVETDEKMKVGEEEMTVGDVESDEETVGEVEEEEEKKVAEV